MTLAAIIKKKTVQKFSHLNAFNLEANLTLTLSMEKNSFYHIWAWWSSWSCNQDHLNKLSFAHLINLHMKFEFNWLNGLRGKDV